MSGSIESIPVEIWCEIEDKLPPSAVTALGCTDRFFRDQTNSYPDYWKQVLLRLGLPLPSNSKDYKSAALTFYHRFNDLAEKLKIPSQGKHLELRHRSIIAFLGDNPQSREAFLDEAIKTKAWDLYKCVVRTFPQVETKPLLSVEESRPGFKYIKKAIKAGCPVEVFRDLLSRYPICLPARGELLATAAEANNLEIAQELLTSRAISQAWLDFALPKATGKVNLVIALHRLSVIDPQARNQAILDSVKKGCREVIQYCLSHRLIDSALFKQLLMIALDNDDLEMVKLLLSKEAADQDPFSKITRQAAILHAAQADKIDILKHLLREGLITHVDIALASGQQECLKNLLSKDELLLQQQVRITSDIITQQ